MARKGTTKKGAGKTRARKSARKPRARNGPAMTMPPKREARGAQALRLREEGKSWPEIGKAMGISASYARNCAQDYAGVKSKLPPRKAK